MSGAVTEQRAREIQAASGSIAVWGERAVAAAEQVRSQVIATRAAGHDALERLAVDIRDLIGDAALRCQVSESVVPADVARVHLNRLNARLSGFLDARVPERRRVLATVKEGA